MHLRKWRGAKGLCGHNLPCEVPATPMKLLPLPDLKFLGAATLALAALFLAACDDDPGYSDADGRYAEGAYYRDEPGPRGGYSDPGYGGLPPQENWSAAEMKYFQRGYDAGRRDKSLLRTSDPNRYRDDFTRAARRHFEFGYAQGYGDVSGPSTDMNPTQRRIYQQGWQAGAADYQSGRRSNYTRHRGSYPNVVEPYFALGYNEGFGGQPPR